MLILLLMIQIIWSICILLSIAMLKNHLAKITYSLSIYHDSKAYKTKEDISFIESIIKKYSDTLQELRKIDSLGVMIEKRLYNEKVGNFNYLKIRHLALKGKLFNWIIIFLELSLFSFKVQKPMHLDSMILIILSIFLSIMLEIYTFIQDIETKEALLTTEVEDYILNHYPYNKYIRHEKKLISKLRSKIDELEGKLAYYMEIALERDEIKKEHLSQFDEGAFGAREEVVYLKEEDIKSLIKLIK